MRLFTEIDRIFGRKLPLATLLGAPTIEQLAPILRSKQETISWSSLVAIQPNGNKPPFFCVYAHDRNTFWFRDLAQRLGSDQPLYGLVLELDRNRVRQNRVEDFASHYIQQIRTRQPEGPYFLGGYCAGGKIALEMADHLCKHGDQVALLAVIDAYAPGYLKLRPWIDRSKTRVKLHMHNIKRLRVKDRLSYVIEKGDILLARSARRINQILTDVFRTTRVADAPDRLDGQNGQEIQAEDRGLSRTYPQKVYPGKITVLAPTQGLDSYYHEPHMGWNSWAGKAIEIHEIPGKSTSILVEPSIRVLAQRLKDSLHRAADAFER